MLAYAGGLVQDGRSADDTLPAMRAIALFRCPPVLLAVVALVAAAVADAASATQVYRCTTAGQVLYTDAPCRDATVVDLPADRAAPDATERLRRDQQMLDAGSMERRARLAQEQAERDARRAQSAAARDALAANDSANAPVYDGYAGYGWVDGGASSSRNRRRADGGRRDVHEPPGRMPVRPVPTPLPVRRMPNG